MILNGSPTTEGKAVELTSRTESIYPVFYAGTQPFSIPGPESSPKADSLPRSIQVSLALDVIRNLW